MFKYLLIPSNDMYAEPYDVRIFNVTGYNLTDWPQKLQDVIFYENDLDVNDLQADVEYMTQTRTKIQEFVNSWKIFVTEVSLTEEHKSEEDLLQEIEALYNEFE